MSTEALRFTINPIMNLLLMGAPTLNYSWLRKGSCEVGLNRKICFAFHDEVAEKVSLFHLEISQKYLQIKHIQKN
tara:strand:+ start:164 stop:388 length:225 start_codon:yes stop_codon:yes gene_type:complete